MTRSGNEAARVLVADDDATTRRQLRALLEGAGYVVDVAVDGNDAIHRATASEPDVALLDVVMPHVGGLDACRAIKARAGHARLVPVLLLVPKTDATSRARGLAAGADDWVQKPIDGDALLARVAALVRMKRVHEDMRAARELLERMSARDELTGMVSYRALSHSLREAIERASKLKEPLTAVVFDVDGLDRINAKKGRPAGDDVLRVLAAAVARRTREVDISVRYGPDEALVLMPRTSLLDALGIADVVLESFAHESARIAEPSLRATLSAGVASFPGRDVRDAEELLRATDHALACAKRAGGARACAFRQQGMLLFGKGARED